jgi:hypothetical protein
MSQRYYSQRNPRGLAHPVLHLRATAMVPTALTSNVGGLRLERGLGVTVIRTSLPSKSRNPHRQFSTAPL